MVTIKSILKDVKKIPVEKLPELHQFMRKIIVEAEEKEQEEFEKLLFQIDAEMSSELNNSQKSAEIRNLK